DTLGSRFDTLLAVYTGTSVNALVVAPRSVGLAPNDPSEITFEAVAGTTYRIAVDGRDGQAGLCTLNWRPVTRLTSPGEAQGSLRFTLLGQAVERCLIETSADLQTWSPWLRVTNLTGSLSLTDSPVAEQRFYRSRKIP